MRLQQTVSPTAIGLSATTRKERREEDASGVETENSIWAFTSESSELKQMPKNSSLPFDGPTEANRMSARSNTTVCGARFTVPSRKGNPKATVCTVLGSTMKETPSRTKSP